MAEATADDDREVEFSCRVDNVKTFTNILACLFVGTKKDHPCYVEVTDDALTFIVTSRTRATQARAMLQRELFDTFECNSNTAITFGINIATLLDCLQIFGCSTENKSSATMSYNSRNALFKVSLVESGVLTMCDICTLYTEDLEDGGLFLAFRDHPVDVQLILHSEPLKEAVAEMLVVADSNAVKFGVYGNPEVLKMTTVGSAESCEMIFAGDLDSLFVSFRCDANCIEWCYPCGSLELCMKALVHSKESCIRLNSQGIMCIQHQIETSINEEEAFIDFLMIPKDMNVTHQ